METSNMVSIDFSNFDQLRELMDTYGEDKYSLFSATNANDESQQISINPDHIVVDTLQNNGWIRRNVYRYDETTEELFEGTWK